MTQGERDLGRNDPFPEEPSMKLKKKSSWVRVKVNSRARVYIHLSGCYNAMATALMKHLLRTLLHKSF